MGIRHSTAAVGTDSGDDKISKDAWDEAHIGGEFVHSSKASADTPDDEFASGTLDAQWTVVAGASGTVNFLEAGNVAEYDLASRSGCLLIQVGSAATQAVLLRQDWTLPDGYSIVAAISLAIHAGAMTADEIQIGLSLNSDDSTYNAGSTHVEFYAAEMDSAPDIQSTPTGHSGGEGSVTSASAVLGNAVGRTIFLRIARSGLWYYPSWSLDGYAWVQHGGTSWAAEHNNLWLFARNAGATGTPVPIHTVHWIRQGGNGLDPWPWT